jgi:hypothetical protein
MGIFKDYACSRMPEAADNGDNLVVCASARCKIVAAGISLNELESGFD